MAMRRADLGPAALWDDMTKLREEYPDPREEEFGALIQLLDLSSKARVILFLLFALPGCLQRARMGASGEEYIKTSAYFLAEHFQQTTISAWKLRDVLGYARKFPWKDSCARVLDAVGWRLPGCGFGLLASAHLQRARHRRAEDKYMSVSDYQEVR